MDLPKILNITLIIIIITLIINIFGSYLILDTTTITGQMSYKLDQSETLCSFKNSQSLNQLSLDQCCYEALLQLRCNKLNLDPYDIRCYTSETSQRYLLLNNKAFSYCQKEGYDVKIE